MRRKAKKESLKLAEGAETVFLGIHQNIGKKEN